MIDLEEPVLTKKCTFEILTVLQTVYALSIWSVESNFTADIMKLFAVGLLLGCCRHSMEFICMCIS